MECTKACREFCDWVENLPYHRKYALPKDRVAQLPHCFSETFLGEMVPGAIRQFRGPCGAHVHEFEDRWVLHRDRANADEDPLGHLLRDAPEYLASLAAVLAAGLALGHPGTRRSGTKGTAALASGLLGVLALVGGKFLKSLEEDPDEKKSPHFKS